MEDEKEAGWNPEEHLALSDSFRVVRPPPNAVLDRNDGRHDFDAAGNLVSDEGAVLLTAEELAAACQAESAKAPEIPAGETCPPADAGVPLVAFQSGHDGGMAAFYQDGSTWWRPPGRLGEGLAWVREEGPVWSSPPAGTRTLGLIKASATGKLWRASGTAAKSPLADAVEMVLVWGYSLSKVKGFEMTPAVAAEIYKDHHSRDYYPRLLASVVGRCTALVIEGPGAVEFWRELIGPADPTRRGPEHLRHRWGDPLAVAENGFHGSDSPEAAEREIAVLLPLLREG